VQHAAVEEHRLGELGAAMDDAVADRDQRRPVGPFLYMPQQFVEQRVVAEVFAMAPAVPMPSIAPPAMRPSGGPTSYSANLMLDEPALRASSASGMTPD
jgi:hypothetical protein